MKKRIAILAVITASFLLTACERHETEKAQQGAEARLIVVDESTMSYRIYVDKETKVMYLHTKQGYGEAVCVMVDPDGKPLLWDGEQP